MKYAPTPWRHEEGKVVAADGSVIARARCSESCKTYNDEFDEVLANALLMAAAPDLLEALEEILLAIAVYAPDYMHGIPTKEYMCNMTRAIAKSKGEIA